MGSTSGHTSHLRDAGALADPPVEGEVFPRFVVVAGGVGSEAREDARRTLARGDGGVGGGVGGL